MRNNEERVGPNSTTPQMSAGATPASTMNPAFSFVVPTEQVNLPTRGKFYPEGHPWKDKDCVEIKFMTAKEEEILNNKGYIKKGNVLDKLIESILVDSVDVSTIYNGDKNAILKAARITAFGSDYSAPIVCPNCMDIKSHVFDLEDVGEYTADDAQFNSDGTFDVELPVSKIVLRCRLLNGKDDLELSKLHQAKIAAVDKTTKDPTAQKKAKEELDVTARLDQYKQFVVAVNGNTDQRYINAFLNAILARDSKHLRNEYKLHSPDIDLTYSYECGACSAITEVQIPITKDFFWGD